MSNKIETYAVFHNVDKSVLGTNIFFKNFGYEFISMNLEELEKKFYRIFFKDYNPNDCMLPIENSNIKIPEKFYKIIEHSYLFGKHLVHNQEIIFLKTSVDFTISVDDNESDIGIAMKHEMKLQEFVDLLVKQFRLFKHGDIGYSTIIQIGKNFNRTSQNSKSINLHGDSGFKLNQEEIDMLGKSFKETFKKKCSN